MSDCFEKKRPNRFGLQAQHFDNDRGVGTLRRAEGLPCDLREEVGGNPKKTFPSWEIPICIIYIIYIVGIYGL